MSDVPMNYGRRKDDFVLPDLPPEATSNLTDSQKVHIKILQGLTSLSSVVNDLQHKVNDHNKLLVTGDGEPSLQERIRILETFKDGLLYWSRLVGGAIIIQTITFFIGIIVALVQFLPVLEKLAKP